MKEIQFSFGIITDVAKREYPYILQIIQSIQALNIPEYEILIVGPKDSLDNQNFTSLPNVKIINFNDKPGWITKQKNLITKNAKYENIVFQHDYIYYNFNWYEGYKKFGDNFTVCMNKIVNQDGSRFRDWVLFPHHHCYPMNNPYARKAKELWNFAGIENNECLLPYEENRLIKYQYISGSYWVAKKYIMQEFPLDESLFWGNGEDVIWSMAVLDKYNFSMNINSMVHFAKWKHDAFSPFKQECLDKCINLVTGKG